MFQFLLHTLFESSVEGNCIRNERAELVEARQCTRTDLGCQRPAWRNAGWREEVAPARVLQASILQAAGEGSRAGAPRPFRTFYSAVGNAAPQRRVSFVLRSLASRWNEIG